jgi:hypothetical protein
MADRDAANEHHSLPTERDFVPLDGDLDAQHAWRNFGGLTLEEAITKFREAPENHQEDFMFMGGRAFAFYFPVVEGFLREDPAFVGDDREAWILAHCILTQFSGMNLSDVIHLAPRALGLANFVLANVRQFGDPDDQQRIQAAWRQLKDRIESLANERPV